MADLSSAQRRVLVLAAEGKVAKLAYHPYTWYADGSAVTATARILLRAGLIELGPQVMRWRELVVTDAGRALLGASDLPGARP